MAKEITEIENSSNTNPSVIYSEVRIIGYIFSPVKIAMNIYRRFEDIIRKSVVEENGKRNQH